MKECWCFFFSAAAHDAAKINSSPGTDVRLARTGGQLGAQCVERKQPPPQDVPRTQPQPRTCVALSSGASRAFAHAGFAALLMAATVVALQSQHTLTAWIPIAFFWRKVSVFFISMQVFLGIAGLFCCCKNNADGCCKVTVGNRFARGRMLTVNKFTQEQ